MAELGVHQSALLTDLALCVNRYRLFSPGWYVCVLAKVLSLIDRPWCPTSSARSRGRERVEYGGQPLAVGKRAMALDDRRSVFGMPGLE